MKNSPTLEPKQADSESKSRSFLSGLLSSKIVRIGGTLCCLWLIARNVDATRILHTMQNARMDLILVGWLVTCCVMIFATAEWGIIVRSIKRIGWGELSIIFLRMLAPSVVLPAGIGGEAVRIYQISRHLGAANATAAAAFARMSSAFAMAILAFAGATRVHASWSGVALASCAAYMLATFAIWSVAFYPDDLVEKFVAWLNGWNKKFVSTTIVPFVLAIHEIGKKKSAVFMSLAASLLGWGTNFAALQLFAVAVGAVVPWYFFAVALPLSLISTFAPFVLGGIGVREGILMAILMQSGISSEQAGVIALLVDIQMVPFMVLSALAWLIPQKQDSVPPTS